MPYAHKTSQPTKDALRRGDLALAVNGLQALGPTSTTGYYNTINPPAGGYAIYSLGLNNNPIAMTVTIDDELIRAANTLGGSVSTTDDALSYLAGRTSTWILQSYPNNIITDGLVLALNAGNLSSYPTTGTTFYDLSGEGNNGTLVDAPPWSNGYFDFDGSTGYIAVSNLGLSSHTIEGWINSSDASQGSDPTSAATIVTVIGEYDAVGEAKYTYIGFYSPNILTFRIDDGGSNSHRKVADVSYTADTWYHVALTYDASNGSTRAYLNGSDIGGIAFTTGLTFDSIPFNISQNDYNGNIFDGLVGSVRTYNRALTASEISQNYYQAPIVTDDLILALDPGNLVSYENGSTTTYSLVGTNTGTLTGGVTFDGGNGGVWNFDGNDDRIESFSNSVQPATITIEFWKKWTSVSDDWLIGNQTSSPTQNNYGWYARIDSPSYNFIVRFGIGSTSRSIVYNPIVLNEWTHVVATYDPTSEGAKLYWNGELVGTNTNAGALDYTNVLGLEIGGANDGSRDTPGPVGPVRIYDRVLTAGEVAQNHQAQINRFL